MSFFKKSGGASKPRQKTSVQRVPEPPATISHPALGEIAVVRSLRAKRIIVSVKPPGRVRLTIPAHIPAQEGIRFLDSRQDWVLAALERQKAGSNTVPIAPPFETRCHSLRLTPAPTDKIRISVRDGFITVSYPRQVDYRDEQIQSAIKKGIEMAWRIEAWQSLPGRTRELALSLGLDCNGVTVRNTVSRWGSCSTRNDISLSIHLMRLPDHLIDYVIIHELCHTKHKNHGPQFHALLNDCTAGRHLALRKQLREYRTRW